MVGVVWAALLLALPSRRGEASSCDCARFEEELAAAHALFVSRGEGATLDLGPAARERYRDRVLDAYDRACCLVDCAAVPEGRRDEARVLLAESAFKSRDVAASADATRARVERAFGEMVQCVSREPVLPACHLWHASFLGVRAEDSWSPMQLALPRKLIAEFRAARGDRGAGAESSVGAATRGEAAVLMRAPRIAGGDTAAAVALMEEASHAPSFVCSVDNRLVYAEALARSGDAARALAELRAAVAYGMPACGERPYENAVDLAEAARCAARLAARPDADPGWSTDCE